MDLEDIESYTSRLLSKKHRLKNKKIGSIKHCFKTGDILFSKLRVYLKKVIIADECGFCSSEILPLRFFGCCINEYARYYFLSSFFLNKVETLQYGCKMPRLGTQDGKKMLFPLPPINEQKNIIELVSGLIKSIVDISTNIGEIRKDSILLKAKILNLIFSENSSYKSYYQMNDIFDFQNGYAFPSETYSKTGTPIIRISDLTDGVVTLDKCVKTNQNNIDEKFIVRNGDLLIAMSGATTGKMGVFVGEENCYLNQRVGNIKIKRKDLIIDGYRNYLFMH